MSELQLRQARFAELSTTELYALLRLRADVFVVEQDCPYQDLDGRDSEPDTVHLWYQRDGRPVSYVRILTEPASVLRIGRVCTEHGARGAGLADRLFSAALALTGACTVVLGAQSYLTGFYARHGFTADGPEYLEDGIPHTPMIRTPSERHPR